MCRDHEDDIIYKKQKQVPSALQLDAFMASAVAQHPVSKMSSAQDWLPKGGLPQALSESTLNKSALNLGAHMGSQMGHRKCV